MNRLAAAAAAALLSLAPLASADSVGFTAADRGVAPSYTYTTVAGVDLSVSATGTRTSTLPALVHESTLGLGVVSHLYDSSAVDGFYKDDTLHLDFAKTYSVESLTFTEADDLDVVKLFIDGQVHGHFSLADAVGTGGTRTLALGGITLDRLSVETYGDHSSWHLAGLTGHAVPTPSAALAGLLGLLGVTARRRRVAA